MGDMTDWQIDQMTHPDGDFEPDDEKEQDAFVAIEPDDYGTLRDRFESRYTRDDGSPR